MNKKLYGDKDIRVIALCMTKFYDKEQERFAHAFIEESKKNNVKVFVFASMSELSVNEKIPVAEEKIFSLFCPEEFDAVVIMTETFKNKKIARELADRVLASNVPVISFMSKLERCINITFSFGDSFEKIVRHVVEEHHVTNFHFLAGFENNPFSQVRIDSFKKVLAEYHIPFDDQNIGYGDFWEAPTRKVIQNWIRRDKTLPEAIVCANDAMAIAAIRELKKFNIKVPDDIIVTGFDGIDLERYIVPRLTTAEYDLQEVIQLIFHEFDQIIQKNPDYSPGRTIEHIMDFEMRVGGSCGCVYQTGSDANEKIIDMVEQQTLEQGFDHEMYEMTLSLNNLADIHTIIEKLPDYLKTTDFKNIWICFNDDILTDQMDFSYRMIPSHRLRDVSGYSDYLLCALHKSHGEYQEGLKFSRRSLLPNFQKVIHDSDCIYFIPLNFHSTTLGYIAVERDFEAISIQNLQSFIRSINQVLENARNHSEKENLYTRDSLTTLYNRRGFYKYVNLCLDYAVDKDVPLTIISVDMDGLKQINDQYGHMEGDFVIRMFSGFMLAVAAPEDVLSRFGGDEFIFAFASEDTAEKSKKIMNSIKRKMDDFNYSNEKDYKIGASFGIFTSKVTNETTLDYFIKNADEKMYHEKANHKKGTLL